MPQLRGQLPLEDLEDIMASEEQAEQQIRLARERRGKFAAASDELAGELKPRSGKRDAGGKVRDFPHVRCNCCEHKEPKPWMQNQCVGAAASALIDAALA